jgi:hypothetical protein
MAHWLYAGLAAPDSGCHLVRPRSAGLTDRKARQPHGNTGSSAIVSLDLLSCVRVIVPDRFQAQEGLTNDDVQARRPVTHNKVLRAMYCKPGSVRLTLAWKHDRLDVGDSWSTARPSGDGA